MFTNCIKDNTRTPLKAPLNSRLTPTPPCQSFYTDSISIKMEWRCEGGITQWHQGTVTH